MSNLAINQLTGNWQQSHSYNTYIYYLLAIIMQHSTKTSLVAHSLPHYI